MPKIGDERTVTKFLWFPKLAWFKDKLEWRWLKKETFTERFQQCHAMAPDCPDHLVHGWKAYRWLQNKR